ncbi:MAG: CoB--CoM heterodisulfide reductase iron-sulfur subunit A family protein [Candidatus Coatesbacteria bacterium]|nr:CoB--CoM heterodisulfide reductase iron-sulfur subunit A family protein [Candidatus Coatesbacteria bacterium]
MKRIGVFVCWCGSNIAGTVDVEKVAEHFRTYPGVVHAESYQYLCSEPGQKIILNRIKEHGLKGVVIAACSPTMHESTFRNTVQQIGFNPFQLEIANIREQVSWVTEDKDSATSKAITSISQIVEKLKGNEALDPIQVPVTKKALVIGGGIAGIEAALNIAKAGYKVYLVEKEATIGGHMAQLSETFPTLDCSQCILTPKMVEVARHPNVELYTLSKVTKIEGFIGNFKVTVHKEPDYVKRADCTACGDCAEVCPVEVPSEFNQTLKYRKAIYIPSPQAVPTIYHIDPETCLGINPIKCNKCAEACERKAIDFDQQPEDILIEVGAIVVATGYDLYDKELMAEYGYGRYQDVIDGLQFERILSASGPTEGKVLRPSDGTVPKRVVFVQCCGSRDPEHHKAYCSKICCMYTAKHALLYKHKVHDGKATVFYMDIRANGKRYEEFVQNAIEHEHISYLRGRVSKIYQENDHLVVMGADTLSGKRVEIEADLVVLAMAMVPGKGTMELAKLLKVGYDENGFLNEAHPKLRPVESLTGGVFIAGAVQAPKDIPETVAQASGAASKVLEMFGQDYLWKEPTIVDVDGSLCSMCGNCVLVCPYGARSLNKEKHIVEVNAVLCESCGACAAACPTGAAQQRNLTDKQIVDMIEVALEIK